MTVLVNHTFTAADNSTGLPSADTGQATQVLSGVWGIQSNQAYWVSGTALSVWESNQADVQISLDSILVADNPTFSGAIAFRVSDVNNYWMFRHNGAGAQLYKIVSGSATLVASGSISIHTGTVTFKVKAQGNTIQCTIRDNGGSTDVDMFGTITDTFNQTATKHGLRNAATTTTKFDNLQISDFNTGGTPTTVTSVVATATADTVAPIVTAQKQINVSSVIASITADALAPTITTVSSLNTSIDILAATLTANAINPSLRTDNTITSVIAAMGADAVIPSLSVSSTIATVIADGTADALNPQVGSFTNVSINAVLGSAMADSISPVVDVIRNIGILPNVADAVIEAFVPNVLAVSSSVQITSVIAEVLAEVLTPRFYQLWKEISLNPVSFTNTSPSVNTTWRAPERTVNLFK